LAGSIDESAYMHTIEIANVAQNSRSHSRAAEAAWHQFASHGFGERRHGRAIELDRIV
jgi:hypothetical protein